MNAIDLLKTDHDLVKNLLDQLTNTTERAIKKRTDLVAKLEMELAVHTALEEKILYPAFKEAGERMKLRCITRPRKSTAPWTLSCFRT